MTTESDPHFVSTALHTASQSHELDRLAMATGGLAGGELMERAGRAAYHLLRLRWPRARSVLVVCGPGNNGGDGYVVACLAASDGLTVTVLALGDAERLPVDAGRARERFEQEGGRITGYQGKDLPPADVIVDALLGIGSDRELAGDYLRVVTQINGHAAPVLAMDLPTGVHADSGRRLGAAIKADATISFISRKPGMFTGDGIDDCGVCFFDDLGVATDVVRKVEPVAQLVSRAMCRKVLPSRPRNTHKGRSGSVLVIGGEADMPGAAALAAGAALHAGAGLVHLAGQAMGNLPNEIIRHTLQQHGEVRALLGQVDSVVIGPGLGQRLWGQQILSAVLDSDRTMVLDADGLTLLAAEPVSRDNWILTPHPGEAARLLGVTTQAIQSDRIDAARQIVQRYGGVCVLKGAGTIIASEDGVFLCDRGHPGMATAGMGDVLGGIIGALVAQGMGALDAARCGVWLHAVAAEQLAAAGRGIGMLASDVSAHLPLVRSGLGV